MARSSISLPAVAAAVAIAIGLLPATLAAQTIDSVAPTTLPRNATTQVVVRGSGLDLVTGVSVSGGDLVVGAPVVTADLVSFSVGVGATAALGPRDVHLDGGEGVDLAGAVTVAPGAIEVLSLSPASGARGQTLDVAVSGSNLDTVTLWSFGADIDVLDFSTTTPTRGTVRIVIGDLAFAGARAVTAARADDTFTLEAAFTVSGGALAVDDVSPGAATRGQTVELRIDGNNLDAVDSVSLGAGVPTSNLRVVSPGRVLVDVTVLDDAAAGARTLTVRAGDTSLTVPNAFVVLRGAAAILDVRPDRLRQGDATWLTIDGENLDAATSVDLGEGVTIAAIDARFPTSISVDVEVAMDAATGFRDVRVAAPAGTVTATDALIVAEYVPPVLDLRFPDEIDIGDTRIGAYRQRGLAIENAGEQSETVRLVAVDGDADLFGLLDDDGFSVSDLEFEIAPGEQIVLTAEFAPVLRGRAGVAYDVTARGGQSVGTVIVRGTGLARELLWSLDAPYDFGVLDADVATELPRLDTLLKDGVPDGQVGIEGWEMRLRRDGAPVDGTELFTLEFVSTLVSGELRWGTTEIEWTLEAPAGRYEGELLLLTDTPEASLVPFGFIVDVGGVGPGDGDDVGDEADAADIGPDASDTGTPSDAGDTDDIGDTAADTGTPPDGGDDTAPDAPADTSPDAGGSDGGGAGCCSTAHGSPAPPATLLVVAAALVAGRRRIRP